MVFLNFSIMDDPGDPSTMIQSIQEKVEKKEINDLEAMNELIYAVQILKAEDVDDTVDEEESDIEDDLLEALYLVEEVANDTLVADTENEEIPPRPQVQGN